MLANPIVIVGKFYVNNGRRIAREVLRTSGQRILFNTYHLDTGNSCGSPSECRIQDFVCWADHEATSAELASLQVQVMEAQFYAP